MFNKDELTWMLFGLKIGLFSGLLIGVGIGFYFTAPLINQIFGVIATGIGVITLIGAFARLRGITYESVKNMKVEVRRYT